MSGILSKYDEDKAERNRKDHNVKQVWKDIHCNFNNYTNEQD